MRGSFHLNEQQLVDRVSFGAAVALIVLACIPLIIYPNSGGTFLLKLYDFIARELGFLYLGAGLATLTFLAWLAFGRYGRVRLAQAGETVEFGNISWAAMLFCAGIGAGLLAWAPIEWAYYLDAPPFGAEPRSIEAMEWASSYGIFHWGFTAWAFYCLPAIAIAYPYYVKRTRSLRFSNSCYYWLKGKEDTRRGRLIDFLFMIGLLGGAGSSLGFSTPMISALVARLGGIEASFSLEIAVVGVSVLGFVISVWLGLKKGIKRLSEINLWIALVFSVTTYDSASYILASSATRNLPPGEDPQRWHRVFWAVALAVLPLTLMFVGGLKVVQTATLVVSLPLLAVGALMAWSLARQLKEDNS